MPKEYNDNAPLHADSWVQKQDSNAMTDPSKKEDAFPIKLPIAGGKGYVSYSLPSLYSVYHLSFLPAYHFFFPIPPILLLENQ